MQSWRMERHRKERERERKREGGERVKKEKVWQREKELN